MVKANLLIYGPRRATVVHRHRVYLSAAVIYIFIYYICIYYIDSASYRPSDAARVLSHGTAVKITEYEFRAFDCSGYCFFMLLILLLSL